MFDGNLVFQLDDLGVHRGDLGARGLQRCHSAFALGQRVAKVHFHPRFLGVEQVQLALQEAHDHVGFGDQVLQLVINRGGAEPFLPHRFRFGGGEDADKAFHARLGAHLIEVFGKARRDVIQPHDQLGDVGVHHLGVLVHIVERGVFHINRQALIELGAGGFDLGGYGGNLGLRLGNLFLAFLNLRVEIGHLALRVTGSRG